jgi:outer membrane receptor for monomeric catechols
VNGKADLQGRDSLRTSTTNIGKGSQQLRDIRQSITVITEKLIDDRDLDTMKDVMRNAAGITFQAAEGCDAGAASVCVRTDISCTVRANAGDPRRAHGRVFLGREHGARRPAAPPSA